MARGSATGLAIRHRLGDGLPAMFLDDDFVQRFCDGLDQVLAPVPSALDNFWALLDPDLTPDDFLEWIGSWVGVDLDRGWPQPSRRPLVKQAAVLHRRRGTSGGLADLIELFVGVRPAIVEGGASSWSLDPQATLPGSDTSTVVVRIAMARPDDTVVARLDALIAANKPGHLEHRLEFVAPRPTRTPPPPPQLGTGPGGDVPAPSEEGAAT